MIIQGGTFSDTGYVGSFGLPDVPTSVSATLNTVTSANVSFTGSSNSGGTPIKYYTATSNNGISATGTSSPITVTGLSIGNTYTFTVTATTIQGTSASSEPSNSLTMTPTGQKLWVSTANPYGFTTQNTYLESDVWVVPDGVTSISIVCIGSGSGGQYKDTYIPSVGGGGGALAYENNVSVTPGETLYITYGPGHGGTNNGSQQNWGSASTVWRGTPFGSSSTLLCGASGGRHGYYSGSGPSVVPIQSIGGSAYVPGTGSTPSLRSGSGTTATGGYGRGGAGGAGTYSNGLFGGGGGAGGYGGAGGRGADTYFAVVDAAAGANGGGGGGGKTTLNGPYAGGAGGGTTPMGQGSNGSAGTNGNPASDGGGGTTSPYTRGGLVYGGGGGSVPFSTWNSDQNAMAGGKGCVRIIWPGTTRQFPSTNTSDM